eukprot:357169-Chlamydomonas_euryale.AAC.5
MPEGGAPILRGLRAGSRHIACGEPRVLAPGSSHQALRRSVSAWRRGQRCYYVPPRAAVTALPGDKHALMHA